jgi:hypothetical protein
MGEDWFAVDLDAGDDLHVQIVFSTFDGDLDLHLHEPSRSTPSERSEGTSGREEVTHRALRSGEHTVRVFTDDEDIAAMDYRMTIEVTTPGDRCPEDRAEPNDSRTRAETVREGTLRDLTLCGDEDWYSIDAEAGDELRWNIDYDQIGGGNDNINIELLTDRGQRLDDDRGSSGRAGIAHDVEEDGEYFLRVYPQNDDTEFEYELVTDIR